MESGHPNLEAVPWIRLVRSEPGDTLSYTTPGEVRGFDVVHADFLPTYVARALETGHEFARRASEFAQQIVTGAAVEEKPVARGDDFQEIGTKEGHDHDDLPYEHMSPRYRPHEFTQWIANRWFEAIQQLHRSSYD